MSEVNKIANYNQMMSWLTRPATPKTQVADLVDDLEPGSLKDELLKDFDPSQETHEEYLQRKNLDRPFNAQDGGRANLSIGGGVIEGKDLAAVSDSGLLIGLSSGQVSLLVGGQEKVSFEVKESVIRPKAIEMSDDSLVLEK